MQPNAFQPNAFQSGGVSAPTPGGGFISLALLGIGGIAAPTGAPAAQSLPPQPPLLVRLPALRMF